MSLLKMVDDEESILHFSLSDLLPAEHMLAVDTKGWVALLANDNGIPHIRQALELTDSEIAILLPLLASYPYYCPHEVLLASQHGPLSERAIAMWRGRLEMALAENQWDYEMRPVRNILSRTRIKTRRLGIDIKSIIETGYMLSAVTLRTP